MAYSYLPYPSHPPCWPSESLRSDVEEIQRDFPPGSRYQEWVSTGGETIYCERSRVSGRSPSRYQDAFLRYCHGPEASPRRSLLSRRCSPRSRSFGPRSRGRSRGRQGFEPPRLSRRRDHDHSESESCHGGSPKAERKNRFKDLTPSGILAAAGKKACDLYRSLSRGRCDDERSKSRSSHRRRTKSVSGYCPGEFYSSSEEYEYCSDGYRPRRSCSVPCHDCNSDGSDQSSSSSSDTSSSSGSSTDEAHTRRKILGKGLFAAGLATVATIHAGHELYESREKRKERLLKLSQGKISPAEARKQRLVGNLKDVATLSVAAYGIKKSIDGWKEAVKHHSEYTAYNKKCRERARKRAQKRALSIDSM
ncbi:uncharacterized protein CIMG_09186 [Coccidioides immitis RS]|uniref:Uncharacterized protein n=2 Tax=Coccidioides immitis TaxID=5501 RepID=J3K1T3_COCIM|nr:uncharacterized protein CIMG_09186 [Coccidioides immitis RS]EAS27982.3 hypothetical protein CIMG_09186 [Coccidioides immitis RS]KMP08790.1 hypothetical protein CIRG_08471 [Coccidioides immitis RMSCC 2394]